MPPKSPPQSPPKSPPISHANLRTTSAPTASGTPGARCRAFAIALPLALLALLAAVTGPPAHAEPAGTAGPPAPLVIGETFTIASKVLGETRRINVYRAPFWGDSATSPRPVLYMPDGGIAEDFLHVAGLLQVSIGNETVRPFLLVGIENTQRRRDLTGPTTDPADLKIAPKVGESAAFRRFLRTELMPLITARYRTTGETAIMGESLAGLFVVETFMTEPGLFDTYIAFDPSLWWNKSAIMSAAPPALAAHRDRPLALYLANSSEERIEGQTKQFADRVQAGIGSKVACTWEPLPGETHATIYHPAALRALRLLFKPATHDH